jgi:hypothetical protein
VLNFFRVLDLILIVVTFVFLRKLFHYRLLSYAYKNARIAANFNRQGSILDEQANPSQKNLYRTLRRQKKILRNLKKS